MAEEVEDDDSAFIIKEGDYVVLKRGDVFKAVQIQLRKKVVFERQWLFLDKAVGQLYGTVFEVVSGGNLEPQKAKTAQSSADAQEAGADNRNIVDDGKSQKLTRDDIETLKEQGVKGQEIIQQLIDNSSTFRDKTEFAQAKYIKKKKKKYESTITVLQPCCRILAMMYHDREPGKICHLRHDTLAQMLTLGNIHAGGKVLVFETCAGLVLGAVMERMGGFGTVVQMYPAGGPVQTGMESFGFPPHFHQTLHTFPIDHVNALLAGTLNTSPPAAEAAADSSDTGKAEEDAGQMDADTGGEGGGGGEGEGGEGEGGGGGGEGGPEEVKMEASTAAQEEQMEREKLKAIRLQEKQRKAEDRRKKLEAGAAQLEGRNADGLIIASRFHPSPVVLGLIRFLAPSRPFVVYSQYREPLIECYTKLKEQGNKEHAVINLRITDSWLRHYQVLPNRTHPVLQMSGGGGYLLSGTTADMRDNDQAYSGQQAEEPPAPKKPKLTGSEG